jgi:hypothetical protein
MNFIYTITSVNIENHSTRCFTWASTLDKAFEIIHQGLEFFTESGNYNYVVIEEVPAGNITQEYREWWLRWDNNEWQRTETPNEGVGRYGIG